jgi:hypothetical protein
MRAAFQYNLGTAPFLLALTVCWQEYENKLKALEAEGYDVSELRQNVVNQQNGTLFKPKTLA